jgi:hypothetical protein
MDTTPQTHLDAQREIIRSNVTEIAADIGMVMRDAGLNFPVSLTVRDSGDSFATIATPLRASAIVCQIIERKIDGGKLRSRELLCAVANSVPMIAAEVAPS